MTRCARATPAGPGHAALLAIRSIHAPAIPIKRGRGLLDDPNDPMPRQRCCPREAPPPGCDPTWVDGNGNLRDAEP